MNSEGNSNHPLKILLSKYGFTGTIKTLYTDVLFDYLKGVDTFLPVAREKLFSGERVNLQNRYVPSTFDLVEKSILLLKNELPFQSSNFIDFGSGKGKVLIGAAKFPFKKIKGVEFSEDLHRIAEKNIKKLRLENKIVSIHADAITHPIEAEDRIMYFFNPFMGEVLERCLENILKYKTDQKKYFIYANPTDDEIFCRYLTKINEVSINPGGIRVNIYHD